MASVEKDSGEEDLILDILYDEYWYLMQMACIYPDLRKGYRRNLSILYMALMSFAAIYLLIVCTQTALRIPEDILISSQSIHFCILQIICLSIVIKPNFQRNQFESVHKMIGAGISEYDKETKDGMKNIKDKLKTKKKLLLTAITVYILFAGFLTAILAPFIDNMMSGGIKKDIYSPGGVSYNLPIALWSPFGTHTTTGYLLSLIMELCCAYCVTIVIVSGDITMLIMTQYVTTEIQLLIMALGKSEERTIALYRSKYNIKSDGKVNCRKLKKNLDLMSCYKFCLKETILHHLKIMKAFKEINATISFPIFIAYFSGSIMIAICGVVMLFGNGAIGSLVTAFILGFGEILNMLLISWCGEQISQANEQLCTALYSTKWYWAGKEEAITLQIMMCRSQRPLTLFAGGIVPVNFESFTNVMNSSYSYFNLMYASNTEL